MRSPGRTGVPVRQRAYPPDSCFRIFRALCFHPIFPSAVKATRVDFPLIELPFRPRFWPSHDKKVWASSGLEVRKISRDGRTCCPASAFSFRIAFKSLLFEETLLQWGFNCESTSLEKRAIMPLLHFRPMGKSAREFRRSFRM